MGESERVVRCFSEMIVDDASVCYSQLVSVILRISANYMISVFLMAIRVNIRRPIIMILGIYKFVILDMAISCAICIARYDAERHRPCRYSLVVLSTLKRHETSAITSQF
jgi:hypothetical protein